MDGSRCFVKLEATKQTGGLQGGSGDLRETEKAAAYNPTTEPSHKLSCSDTKWSLMKSPHHPMHACKVAFS
jgi:hypothetical protein